VNALHFQRLKDSSATARMRRRKSSSQTPLPGVSRGGQGRTHHIEMVQLTRLDCAIASAALMRMALVQALHHARHRIVFQKRLGRPPMMAGVLADMAPRQETAIALVMRLCRSFDLPQAIRAKRRGRAVTPGSSSGSASVRRLSSTRRWSAWAAKAMSRSLLLALREAPGQRDLGRLRQCHGA